MPIFYQFSFCDDIGTQIALLAGSDGGQWHSLSYDHIENGVGHATLTVDGRLDFLPDLTDRTILKIKRKVVRGDVVIDWYDEWEGMLEYVEDTTREDVNIIKLEFSSYLDLIRARYIQYKPATIYTDKDGPGETVIKELVEENAGPSANSADRYCNGITTGLSIEADAAQGDRWTGSHSGVPLLDTISKIANGTRMFFDVINTGPATFEFRCYYLQRGVNRSAVGVDKTTGGLNTYGYAPVVFSLINQNMENPVGTQNFRDATSSVTCLGAGQDSDTLHKTVMNALDMARSPWSTREMIIRSAQDYEDSALLYQANGAIIANRVRHVLDFDVVQIDNCLYGRDYTWGDIVTAIYKNIEYTKRISSVSVQVNGNSETIKPVMLDMR